MSLRFRIPTGLLPVILLCACNRTESSPELQQGALTAAPSMADRLSAIPQDKSSGCQNRPGQQWPPIVLGEPTASSGNRIQQPSIGKVQPRLLTAAELDELNKNAVVDPDLLARQGAYDKQWAAMQPSLGNLPEAEQTLRRAALKASIVGL